MNRKYFGTDGVRGKANTVLTPELAYKLGRFGGYVITKNIEKPKFVIGRDTRLSGQMLESALISGLMSVGIEVIQLGVITTPGVAYLTRKLNAQGGVMISASHNPFEDNGIKFFNHKGYKLTDEIELEIESLIDSETDLLFRPSGDEIGRIINYTNGVDTYISFLKETTHNLDLSDFKIVLDCANGAATTVAPKLFSELGATVIAIYNNPDGTNINLKCGSTHPEDLQKRVVEEKANLGLAFDGDADRLIGVDEKGQLIDGDQILYVIGKYLKEKGLLKNNTVVSTVMSNFGFKKALDNINVNTAQTSVGDRYVLEEMLKNDFILGGEQSGHIIFLNHNTTGDGILSALQLVSVLKAKNTSPSNAVSDFVKYPQVLNNILVKNKNGWDKNQNIIKSIDEAEKVLNGNGRVLVRPSGTENLIRVMVEGETNEIVNNLVTSISSVIKQEIN